MQQDRINEKKKIKSEKELGFLWVLTGLFLLSVLVILIIANFMK